MLTALQSCQLSLERKKRSASCIRTPTRTPTPQPERESPHINANSISTARLAAPNDRSLSRTKQSSRDNVRSLHISLQIFTMAISTHAFHQFRRYSTHVPRDPHYRLKATLATGYVVSAFALPFVPPLIETRRAKADGSYLTRESRYCTSHYLGCAK